MVRVGEIHTAWAPVVVAASGCVVTACAVAWFAARFNGKPGLLEGPLAVADGSLLLVLVLGLIALGSIHEASHIVAARFAARLPWRRVALRFSPGHLGVQCRITGRVSVRHHRRIGMAPVLTTAFPLCGLALATGAQLPVLGAILALLLLPADLATLWQLRRYLPDDVVTGPPAGTRSFVFRPDR